MAPDENFLKRNSIWWSLVLPLCMTIPSTNDWAGPWWELFSAPGDFTTMLEAGSCSHVILQLLLVSAQRWQKALPHTLACKYTLSWSLYFKFPSFGGEIQDWLHGQDFFCEALFVHFFLPFSSPFHSPPVWEASTDFPGGFFFCFFFSTLT